MNKQTASHAGARIVSGVCVVVGLAACYPTLALTRWLNTIPNSTTSYNQWAAMFGKMVAFALLGVLVLSIVSRATHIKPLRVASISGIVATPVSALSLVILIPLDGVLLLPSAFYGAAVLFSFFRVLRATGKSQKIIATCIIGTTAFLLCVYGYLFLAKLWSLYCAGFSESL